MTKLCYIKCNHPASVHCSMMAKYTDFIAKDEWPQNSPDINPLDCHMWGAMLLGFHKLQSKPKTIPELKNVLQPTWENVGRGEGLGSIHSVPSSPLCFHALCSSPAASLTSVSF